MRRDDEGLVPTVERQLHEPGDEIEASHIVFDFTGLEQPDVCDLALILTARLQSAPTDSVWVRSIPWQTARVLRILKLDHLFRRYPTETDELN